MHGASAAKTICEQNAPLWPHRANFRDFLGHVAQQVGPASSSKSDMVDERTRPGKHRKEYIVLIVEAGETALSTRKLVLESAGLNVLSAVAANQAYKLMERSEADVAIVDTDVSDLPLPEFCRDLREQFGFPVYVLSGTQFMPDSFKHVADGHFEKMQDPHHMVTEIIRVLGA